MTNRERIQNILHYKNYDRMPAVHFGYWRELLYEWAEQGIITKELAAAWRDGNAADDELNKLIGWDFDWYSCYSPAMGLRPGFEAKVLEVLPDGTKKTLNSAGVIELKHPGVVSIPQECDYLLKDRKVFEEQYLPKMQFEDGRINRAYLETYNEKVYEKLDRPIGLKAGSVLGDIRNMCSLVGMSYLMYDDDETLFADIVDAYAEMQYRCVEEVLKTGAKFDFAHYWEDICYNSGPLLSPAMFDELCAKHYKKRNDLIHSYGIDIISLDCDGVTEKLLGTWLDNGVNVMFPIEIGTWGDQFEKARNKYGKAMLGVGGMDKTALRKDKAAVDEELARMSRLADLGGFVPCPDHRLMPGTKFELVRYYAEKIKEI